MLTWREVSLLREAMASMMIFEGIMTMPAGRYAETSEIVGKLVDLDGEFRRELSRDRA